MLSILFYLNYYLIRHGYIHPQPPIFLGLGMIVSGILDFSTWGRINLSNGFCGLFIEVVYNKSIKRKQNKFKGVVNYDKTRINQ